VQFGEVECGEWMLGMRGREGVVAFVWGRKKMSCSFWSFERKKKKKAGRSDEGSGFCHGSGQKTTPPFSLFF